MNIWIICIILIVLIALARWLSERLFASSDTKTSSSLTSTEVISNQNQPTPKSKQNDLIDDDEETIAAISAAVAYVLYGKQIVIRQITFISPTDDSWARFGRLTNMSSHNIKLH